MLYNSKTKNNNTSSITGNVTGDITSGIAGDITGDAAVACRVQIDLQETDS